MHNAPEKTAAFQLCLLVLAIVLIPLTAVRCGKSIRVEDRMEGFRDTILRVYINTPDCRADRKMICRQDELFMQTAGKRAKALLKNHISLKLKDPSISHIYIEKLPRYLVSGTIIFQRCTEGDCEAFVDYDIKELLDSVKTESDKPAE